MPKKTIREAVITVLKQAGQPLSIKDIYNKIIKEDCYRFNAEQPQHIVSVEVRRHCEGIDFPTAKPTKYFQILSDGRNWLKDTPIPGATNEFVKTENVLTPFNEPVATGV